MRANRAHASTRRRSWGLLLLLVLFPISILVWWGLRRIEALERRQIADTVQTVMTTTAAGLRIWASDVKIETNVTASQHEVQQATRAQIAAYVAGRPLKTPALAQLRQALEPLAIQYGQIGFGIIAPDGTEVASRFDSLLGSRDLIEHDPSTIASALAGKVALGIPFRSTVEIGAVVGAPMLTCAAPIRDATGAVIAALVVRLDPARNFSGVVQLGRTGRTGETYLFSRTGQLLTESRFDDRLREIGLVPPDGHSALAIELRDPGVDLTQGLLPRAPRAAQPLTKMAKSATGGHSGIDVEGYRDYRGVPVVGSWRWLDDLDAGLATEVDRAEVYAPIKAVRRLTLAMLGLLFVVAVSVATLLFGRALRLAEAVARENAAVKSRDDLLAAVSHDLRNPLSSILMNVSVIDGTAATASAAERAHRSLRSIESAARRMARLIDDLLNRTQIETGQRHMERTRQRPESLIAKALEVLLPLASAKQIDIEANVAPDLPDVSADPDRMFEVLSNLAGNAIKFAPEHGKISLGASLVDGEVDFSVSDDGPGIPEEELPHLFERYWRGSTSNGPGVGLGLYIAKQIIEQHGGRIWAESRAGEGATFHFRLGVASPEGAAGRRRTVRSPH